MAMIKAFEIGNPGGKAHPTEVVAIVKVFGEGLDGPILQISTTGSATRERQGGINQTIQLDRLRARELYDLLASTYGF